MKVIVSHLRPVPILVGALLVLAVVAAGARSHSTTRAVAPKAGPAPAVERVSPAHVAAVATSSPVATAAAAPATKAVAPGEAGMRAYIDPETGRIGMAPSPASVPDDAFPILTDSGDGLVNETLPDGSHRIDLQGRFQDYAVIRIGADGQRIISCVKNPKLVEREAPASTPQPEER